jgi:Domain of unknown function (DUF1963)
MTTLNSSASAMIDRIYVLALIVLIFLFKRDLILLGIPLLLLVGLLVLVPLLVFEGVANFLSPKLQRDLITFRYKPKPGAKRLIRHLGLDTPLDKTALAEKAQTLAKAARAVTLRHPNPLYGPLRADRLGMVLDPLLIPANKAFARELGKAWISPAPGPSLGGLVLRVRAATGKALFGKWISVARTKSVTGATSLVINLTTHNPERSWMTPDYPGVATFLAWQKFAKISGLTAFHSNPAWLPLSAQRKLAAITAQLYGTPTQALLARLLNPSSYRALQQLAEDRAKWEPWAEEQKQQATARKAEQATRQSYRANGSLAPQEVTALVTERAQDSILLNRIWPPGTPATGNSWLGGLPCLPQDMGWPRSSKTNLPLHFLAQVDCANLPTQNGASPLPRDGLLLFFSDLDQERNDEGDSGRQAVVHIPKARQSVPPRALPDDLPEIDHSGGKPSSHSDTPGRRHFPKWPVVPTAVKVWGGEEAETPKTFNLDYLEQSRAAHDASLAAVMPPAAASTRLGDLFPYRQRKDADGKPILNAEGKAIAHTVFDPSALPEGFPFCGAGVDAFVARLQQQATKAARRAASARAMIDTKWNDTEEKRARQRAEADQADDAARAVAILDRQAATVLGSLPALAPVPPETIARLRAWLLPMADAPRSQHAALQTALSGSVLDLARAAITDAALLARLPASVFALNATSLVPSPRHAQHLMLGPAQQKTNSTAGGGVRLLCLDSDYGPGMMYCDCGVLEYWISPADLAALRFDRVVAHSAGG